MGAEEDEFTVNQFPTQTWDFKPRRSNTMPTLSFMTATADQQRDATAWLASLPRHLRKQYRPKVKAHTTPPNRASHDSVDSYMKTEFRIDTYHTQNLEFLDRAYDFDEFGDIDNEFDGLTIHEPDSEAALWAFCTGYDNI